MKVLPEPVKKKGHLAMPFLDALEWLLYRQLRGIFLQSGRTNAFDLQQVFDRLERAVGFAVGDDGFRFLDANAFHAFGQVLGRGGIDVQPGFRFGFGGDLFGRLGSHAVGVGRGDQGQQGKRGSGNQVTHFGSLRIHVVGAVRARNAW